MRRIRSGSGPSSGGDRIIGPDSGHVNDFLLMRRERLEKLIQGCAHPRLVFSQAIVGPGKALFAEVCRQGLEGVMANDRKIKAF